MSFDHTNPFRRHPASLAHLPRIVRLYMLHAAIGFALSAIFTGLVLSLDVGGLGHLVANVSGGWLAATVFFMLNGIVFAGVQTGIVVMGMAYDDRPSGGRSQPEPVRVPVRTR